MPLSQKGMERAVLKIKGYTKDDIQALIKAKEDYRTGIKLYAKLQVSKGVATRKLEELYQTSFKQITNWVHRFEEAGIEGLNDKPGRGRKSTLNEEQLSRIKELILRQSPQDYGYNSATWTGPVVGNWFNKQYGVSYKKAQIYNIMKKLGMSYLRSKAQFPEADPAAQETFKEALKKTFDES